MNAGTLLAAMGVAWLLPNFAAGLVVLFAWRKEPAIPAGTQPAPTPPGEKLDGPVRPGKRGNR